MPALIEGCCLVQATMAGATGTMAGVMGEMAGAMGEVAAPSRYAAFESLLPSPLHLGRKSCWLGTWDDVQPCHSSGLPSYASESC